MQIERKELNKKVFLFYSFWLVLLACYRFSYMFGYRDFRGDDRLLSIYKGIIYTDIKQVFAG